jgi:ribonuclease HI
MRSALPRFLLFTEILPASVEAIGGHWKFKLQQVGGSERIEASDLEPQATDDRLHLFSVVRGLEALDQPSHVTLVTASRYVGRGIRLGLDQWRDSGWQWERFGIMTPIKHADLWQRVDRALHYHQLECRIWRVNGELAASDPGLKRRSSPVAPLANWLGWPEIRDSRSNGLATAFQIGFAN